MKICERHWELLSDAVKQQGYSYLIPKTAAEAIAKLETSQNNVAAVDPLMAVNIAILQAGIDAAGTYILNPDENGNHYCPICEAMKYIPQIELPNGPAPTAEEVEQEWINGPVGAVIETCKSLGINPRLI